VFIEGDSVVGIDAKELFDFFDDLLDVDPGLDDSDLVEEVSDEYDLDYEDALEAVSQYTSISKKSRTSMTTRKTRKRTSDGDLCLWIESRRQARRRRCS